jgi:hypothetical protein
MLYVRWLHCHCCCWRIMSMVSDAQHSRSLSVFQGVQYIACILYSAHFSSEGTYQHVEKQENIPEMVQCSPTISLQRLYTYLCVSQTCVWWTMHEDSLYPPHTLGAKPHPGDSATYLEPCHWLRTNHQLLPLKPFTDEATFTYNGINNIRNSHWWSHGQSTWYCVNKLST